MVALDIVKESNARLRELGPGLVALFVGGTSGIGEATAKAFVHYAVSPHVYLVGRSASAAERIIEECKALNSDGRVEFLQADVAELGEVDRICKEITSKEKHINLIVQSQGNLTLAGRIDNSNGLDRKMTLNYYSRMRFITNLLPLLKSATMAPPYLSRSHSILSGGTEKSGFDKDDIELKKSYSGTRCANQTIVMNTFMTEEFASRNPATTFVHSFPGVVKTPIARELPLWARMGLTAMWPVISLFAVPVDEVGERQLYIATSGVFAPAQKPEASSSSGVSLVGGQEVAKGLDGKSGSGAYIVNWNDDIAGNQSLFAKYRQGGIGKTAWDHTMEVFQRLPPTDQKP
ncbi:hypothetical protein BP5796_09257 [Coleophoma crateriformis]|uniref:Uncharacterized protein n=1 Tax=Coleophoma crateriformis TaxID=565419 RepID=A0A3D8R3R6_9HELO|nr:hypothetical protein BP5796_09257 [Coleophoma crateriformis]